MERRSTTTKWLARLGVAGQVIVVLAWATGHLTPAWMAVLVLGGGVVVLVSQSMRRPGEPPPAAVVSAAEGWASFHRELARARRYKRPLSLVRSALVPLRAWDGAGPPPALARMGAALRTVDTVWIADGALWILTPEVDRDTVLRVVNRIALATGLIDRAGVGIATFPDDALTAGALLALVQTDQQAPIHLPVLAGVSAIASGAAPDLRVGEGQS